MMHEGEECEEVILSRTEDCETIKFERCSTCIYVALKANEQPQFAVKIMIFRCFGQMSKVQLQWKVNVFTKIMFTISTSLCVTSLLRNVVV